MEATVKTVRGNAGGNSEDEEDVADVNI